MASNQEVLFLVGLGKSLPTSSIKNSHYNIKKEFWGLASVISSGGSYLKLATLPWSFAKKIQNSNLFKGQKTVNLTIIWIERAH